MSEFSGQETVTSTTTVNPQIETATAEKAYATEVQSPTEPIPAPITKTVEDSVVPDLTTKKETTKTEPIKSTTEEANAKDVLYKSPDIKFDDDPAKYIQAKFESLIYWEYPKKSALYLGSALGVLILTQYYSVLQLLAAFFTLATAANWLYVNTHKQTQRLISGKAPQDVVNPHSDRLQTKGALIARDRVTYAAQLSVDVFEVIAQQVTKLILIEDNTRSAIAIGVSYLVWTLAKYISTKYLVGFFLVSAFSLPRLYLQHQTVIDAQVAEHSEKARVLAKQYGGVAYAKAQDVYQQALSSIKKEKVQKTE